jgi:hypothetical protein
VEHNHKAGNEELLAIGWPCLSRIGQLRYRRRELRQLLLYRVLGSLIGQWLPVMEAQ